MQDLHSSDGGSIPNHSITECNKDSNVQEGHPQITLGTLKEWHEDWERKYIESHKGDGEIIWIPPSPFLPLIKHQEKYEEFYKYKPKEETLLQHLMKFRGYSNEYCNRK